MGFPKMSIVYLSPYKKDSTISRSIWRSIIYGSYQIQLPEQGYIVKNGAS